MAPVHKTVILDLKYVFNFKNILGLSLWIRYF